MRMDLWLRKWSLARSRGQSLVLPLLFWLFFTSSSSSAQLSRTGIAANAGLQHRALPRPASSAMERQQPPQAEAWSSQLLASGFEDQGDLQPCEQWCSRTAPGPAGLDKGRAWTHWKPEGLQVCQKVAEINDHKSVTHSMYSHPISDCWKPWDSSAKFRWLS